MSTYVTRIGGIPMHNSDFEDLSMVLDKQITELFQGILWIVDMD